MPLNLLLGGARSGKSSAAQTLAEATSRPITYLATATAGDDEMAERIDRHRRDRPLEWTTIEEPLFLQQALTTIDEEHTIIIDCLTLWLSNVMGYDTPEATILNDASATAAFTAARPGVTIAVTNEVGLGLVPPYPLGRQFRDLAGRVNRIWADHSARTGFVVAGRILPLIEILDWKAQTDDY